MGSTWKHFKTVCKHKSVVFKECAACGIPWQGLVHDLSKFSHVEFGPSARYFQGNRSPIDAEKEDKGYSMAWLHHKGVNKHHWEWWCDFDKEGNIVANEVPLKYVVEMLCDWIGAGKAYTKEKWTQAEPYNYFNNVKKGRHFHPKTLELINHFLLLIKDEGLEAFHVECRKMLAEQRRSK
jgi:hypothetical protein